MSDSVLSPEDEGAAVEVVAPEPMLAYRHTRVSRFAVRGKSGAMFEFKNHILRIPTSREEEFKDAYRGLLPVDRQAIVKLRVVENEMPVLEVERKGVRGSQGTDSIQAPKLVQPGSPSANTGASGGLQNLLGGNPGSKAG